MNDRDAWRNWLRTFSVVSKSPLCASRTYIRRISAKPPFMCADIRRDRLSCAAVCETCDVCENKYVRSDGHTHVERTAAFRNFNFDISRRMTNMILERVGGFKCLNMIFFVICWYANMLCVGEMLDWFFFVSVFRFFGWEKFDRNNALIVVGNWRWLIIINLILECFVRESPQISLKFMKYCMQSISTHLFFAKVLVKVSVDTFTFRFYFV